MKDTEITVTITLRTQQCSKDGRTKAIFKKDQEKNQDTLPLWQAMLYPLLKQ